MSDLSGWRKASYPVFNHKSGEFTTRWAKTWHYFAYDAFIRSYWSLCKRQVMEYPYLKDDARQPFDAGCCASCSKKVQALR